MSEILSSLIPEPLEERLHTALRQAMALGAEGAEAFVTVSRSRKAKVRNGVLEDLTASKRGGLGLRVLREGRTGIATTTDLSRASFSDLVQQAWELAALGDPDPWLRQAEPSGSDDLPSRYDARTEALATLLHARTEALTALLHAGAETLAALHHAGTHHRAVHALRAPVAGLLVPAALLIPAALRAVAGTIAPTLRHGGDGGDAERDSGGTAENPSSLAFHVDLLMWSPRRAGGGGCPGRGGDESGSLSVCRLVVRLEVRALDTVEIRIDNMVST